MSEFEREVLQKMLELEASGLKTREQLRASQDRCAYLSNEVHELTSRNQYYEQQREELFVERGKLLNEKSRLADTIGRQRVELSKLQQMVISANTDRDGLINKVSEQIEEIVGLRKQLERASNDIADLHAYRQKQEKCILEQGGTIKNLTFMKEALAEMVREQAMKDIRKAVALG